ncbi:MAG TPA: flavin reductase family protein [Acidimicrobiales bacterium]|jgi:flavin reductase (DIM6/NTAB) family NADH-FMN oxidoreductase RutF|nr:flavin reductase family protein [Acidimicrobiales bacterium]
MALDAQAKKVALRAINYGLYVVTAKAGDELAAAGVNWLTQTSFEPPLIAAGIKTDNDSHRLIEQTGVFAVNVLGKDQLDIGKAFFRTSTVEGDTINGYRFEPGPETGCPLIVDLPYWFECRVTDTVARGDHTLFVAETVGAGVRDDSVVPLLLRDTGMNYGG